MNTILKTATGVFLGLALFAALGFGVYSYTEAKEQRRIEKEQKALEKQIAIQDSLLRDIIEHNPNGLWRQDEYIDPMTDDKTIFINLDANGEGIVPSLTIRCSKNRTELYVEWNTYIGTAVRVSTRIDNDTQGERGWEISQDHSASLYPTSPINLIKRLMSAESFVAHA